MLFANTQAAKVESGGVVATGTFAALIAPASPFREGFPEERAKAEFDIYPIATLPAPSAGQVLEAVAAYYDADADKVFAQQARAMTVAEIATRAADLSARIKAAAEAERLRYLTAGSAKALEYEAKRSEAARYLAAKAAADPSAPTVNGVLYPWAYETAKALAKAEPTVQQITDQCELFAARATAWETLGRQIAAAEQAAVVDIEAARAAGDVAAMVAAAAVVWPTSD